ncbi:meiotic recombination protein REC8 homolog [Diadema setosum]|uniref:meiotic recombination protein REC8 homolog n=1 Tax=Diadema setosum TaxID=31175 RepID=UPI003B3B43A8
MFYAHDILQKRGGKFGVIWIAATKGVSLTKRDYCSVCVPKSCEDIINYITLRAPPIGPKGSRPRFSLYLSSQLMVGVARVFEKQFSYFIVDVHELHKRTCRLTTGSFEDPLSTHIQLKKSARSGNFCTMPESALFHDEEFGVMRGSLDVSPDPLLLPEIELISVSPYRAAKLSTSLLELSPSQMEKLVIESPSHIVSSAAEISLKEETSHEEEEIQVPEVDLPPLDGIPDIMSEMEEQQMRDREDDMMEQSREGSKQDRDRDDQLWALDEQTGEILLSPTTKGSPRGFLAHQAILSPIPSQEEPVPSPERAELVGDADVQMEEVETGKATSPDKHKDRGLVTPSAGAVMLPILRLSPIDSITPSPAHRRGRKRRLVFADTTTQLSKKDIRHNMETAASLNRTESLATITYPSAKELFEEPARKALKRNPTLHQLWKSRAQLRQAIVDPETEDLDAPAWSTAYMRSPVIQHGSTTETTSGEDKEEDDERMELIKSVPEILRHEISASPERLRDISLETSQPRAKLEETPQSFVISDTSRLSESRDSSRQKSFHSDTSLQRGQLRPTGDSIKEVEEAIPEELLDLGELPLLPEEELVTVEPLEGLGAPTVTETSTSEDEEGRKRRKEKRRVEEIIPHDSVLRGIGELTAEYGQITFKDLVPITTYRSVAAKIFAVCLEYAAMGLITVRQERPFADIYIQRGRNF